MRGPGAGWRARRLATVATLVGLTALVGCATASDPPDAASPPGPGVDVDQPPDVTALLDPDRGTPPDVLTIEDVVLGQGAEATAGDRLTVHYTGLRWSDGGTFDSSWDRGSPFLVELGAGRVIPGWEQGLVGMRVGGRRVLTIPPSLAYGERGAGAVIGPGETLVFVVDLLALGLAR